MTLLKGLTNAELERSCVELHQTLAKAEALEADKVSEDIASGDLLTPARRLLFLVLASLIRAEVCGGTKPDLYVR